MFRFLRRMIGKIVATPVRRQLRAFQDATHYPQLWQERILQQILRRQTDTDFGRDHHFASIRTAADFRHNVPVAPYEYYDPYITRVRKGDFPRLAHRPDDPHVRPDQRHHGDAQVHPGDAAVPARLQARLEPVGPQSLPGPHRHQDAAHRADVQRLAGIPDRGRHPLRQRQRPERRPCRSASSVGCTACRPASAASRIPRPSITSPCA